MHATKGWEYHENQAAAAAGAVPSARGERKDRRERSERRRSHRHSFKPGSKTRDSISEVQEIQQAPRSREQSSKGKGRGDADNIDALRDASQSRSRTRKPAVRGSKYDFDRDIENHP
jgi:hypothetical protein